MILDPACGTAGFLISSYKHILAANRDADGNSTLTPDDSKRLAGNFQGYDISPDMVRLSLVNMYLHGFVDPHIFEYDTLTSEDRWNDFADVILANPPFMSPKGGIRPHNRFSVQSRRSEVLFVDYMAEHLEPHGPRRHHRARGHHLPEPESPHTAPQDAGRRLPRRRGLASGGRVQTILRRQDLHPDTWTGRSPERQTASPSSKSKTTASTSATSAAPSPTTTCRRSQAELTEYLRRLRSGHPLDDFQPKMGLVV